MNKVHFSRIGDKTLLYRRRIAFPWERLSFLTGGVSLLDSVAGQSALLNNS